MTKRKRKQAADVPMASESVTFRASLLNGVACAPRSMPRAEVERAVNAVSPSGTARGWCISKQRKLEDGTKLPAPCLDDESKVHYFMDC